MRLAVGLRHVGNFAARHGSTKTEGSPGHTGHVEVLHGLGGGRPARFESFVRSIDPRARPTLYDKHRRCRTCHSSTSLTATATAGAARRDPRARRRALVGKRLPAPSRPTSATSCKLAFADRLLGTLLRRLHEKGLYDRALIVVTADNGESFLHRNANRHLATAETIEEIADTPLFIKRPFQHAGRVSRPSRRTEDILPTIADVLGIRMPWRVSGESVFDRSARIPANVDVFMRSGRKLRLSPDEFKRASARRSSERSDCSATTASRPGRSGSAPSAS